MRAAFLQAARGRTDSALALTATAQRMEPTNIRMYPAQWAVLWPALRAEPRHGQARPATRSLLLWGAAVRGALPQRPWSSRGGRRRGTSRHVPTRLPVFASTLAIVLAQADSLDAAREVVAALEARASRKPVSAGHMSGHTRRWATRIGCSPGLTERSPSGRPAVAYLYVDPVFDRYRADPRFKAAVARAGLPPRRRTAETGCPRRCKPES